jgi:hypothetical protein
MQYIRETTLSYFLKGVSYQSETKLKKQKIKFDKIINVKQSIIKSHKLEKHIYYIEMMYI